MDKLKEVVKRQLTNIVEDINRGDLNLTDDDLREVVTFLNMYRKDAPMTKFQACNFLGFSRATFDNLVKDGQLVEGKKVYTEDNNVFWRKKDLISFLKNKEQ